MRRLWLLLVAIALAALPAPARAQPPAPPLVVAAGETIAGDLATVDQPIVVAGLVEGDVTSWSGTIMVEGEVRGDVVSYAGTITLGPTARIGGSVLAVAGGVRTAGAAVAGPVIGEEPVAGGAVVAGVATLFGRQPSSLAPAVPRPLVSGLLTLVVLGICVLIAAVWPNRTTGAATALRRAPLRSAGVGLLSTLLAAVLLPPLGSLLALSLVGLPLLPPLLLVLQLPYLFGVAVLARLATTVLGAGKLHPAVAVGVGGLAMLLPLAALGIAAPFASAALFYLIASIGLGAAILSRAGAYALRR